jgi:hypothetical protein
MKKVEINSHVPPEELYCKGEKEINRNGIDLLMQIYQFKTN